jgi:hypothetical protein
MQIHSETQKEPHYNVYIDTTVQLRWTKSLAMVYKIAIDLGKTQIPPIVNIAVDIKAVF